MDNRNYFTMAIPALLLGVAYLQPINAAPAEDLPNVTGRMTITQQTFTVSGVVTDTNGEPIIGAAILEQGTTNGCVTDTLGNYKLTVKAGAVLRVSFVGYVTREIVLKKEGMRNVRLRVDNEELEEVVVVGYGSVARKNFTG